MTRYRAFLILAAAFFVAAGCSSDDDTPLGSSFLDDSLIQSRPGDVFQDTIVITGDTTFVANRFVNVFLQRSGKLLLGRNNNFETAALVRASFSPTGDDSNATKTVQSADLRLFLSDSVTLGAQFFELSDSLDENAVMDTLELMGPAIPDEGGSNVDRTISIGFPQGYGLPAAMVQDWIRGVTPHNGIAIVLNDPTTTKEAEILSRENTGEFGKFSLLEVDFTDGTSTNYRFTDDGTFVTDLSAPTNNLRLSDGFAQRILFPIDLSELNDTLFIHSAHLVVHIDRTSPIESQFDIELYAPEDSLGTEGILTGIRIVGFTVVNPRDSLSMPPTPATTPYEVRLPVRNIITQILAGSVMNNGFVMRYVPEGNTPRRVDLYPSAAPSNIRPFLEFTVSKPADFPNE